VLLGPGVHDYQLLGIGVAEGNKFASLLFNLIKVCFR
jgi:hypothetical protein